MDENSLEEAESHANALQLTLQRTQDPNSQAPIPADKKRISPQVLNLRQMVERRGVEADKVTEFINSLPEADRDAHLVKARNLPAPRWAEFPRRRGCLRPTWTTT